MPAWSRVKDSGQRQWSLCLLPPLLFLLLSLLLLLNSQITRRTKMHLHVVKTQQKLEVRRRSECGRSFAHQGGWGEHASRPPMASVPVHQSVVTLWGRGLTPKPPRTGSETRNSLQSSVRARRVSGGRTSPCGPPRDSSAASACCEGEPAGPPPPARCGNCNGQFILQTEPACSPF